MTAETSRSRALWEDVTPFAAPTLSGNLEADVVITGAGMAGLSTAYELAEAGRSVIVLDPGPIGGRLTPRTAGHLGFEADDLYAPLIKRRGLTEARQIHLSQRAAVARVEAIVQAEGLDCDFARVDGYLVAGNVDGRDLIDEEFEACQQVGLNDVAYADDAPLAGLDTGACLRFPGQARLNPAKYVSGLAERLQARGVRLFSGVRVASLEETEAGVTLRTLDGVTLRARAAVIATASHLNDAIALDRKQTAFRTYLIAVRVPKGEAADILLWDTAGHSARLQPGDDEDLLIVGGEDHPVGRVDDADERFARLEVWAKGRYPHIGDTVRRWSALVYEPVDHAPFIGRAPDHAGVYLVTGDSRQGLTTGAAAGLILSAQIAGEDSPWEDAYAPSRPAARPLAAVLRGNLDAVAARVEQMVGSDLVEIDALEPGQGGVVRVSGERAGAFRGADGTLQLVTPSCSYAPCSLQFNPFETLWECPCHGCLFTPDGEVLNGPALTPLASIAAP